MLFPCPKCESTGLEQDNTKSPQPCGGCDGAKTIEINYGD